MGRAWGNYSRAVYSYCDIDNIIDPSGWSDWNHPWRQRYPSINSSHSFINYHCYIYTEKKVIYLNVDGFICVPRTAVFGEYECRGKGADRKNRVSWSKSLAHVEAMPFLDTNFIGGNEWLRL